MPFTQPLSFSVELPDGPVASQAYVIARTKTVLDYGAKGDDTADDAPAIQAAIDATGQGGVVYIPPGRYRLGSTVVVSKGITLLGGGWHPRFAPRTNMAAYLRPGVGNFAGTELIRVEPVPNNGAYLDSAIGGGPRLVGLALNGKSTLNVGGQPIAAVACVAGVKDLTIAETTAWEFTGTAFSLATSTGSLRGVVATTCDGDGFAWTGMTDVTVLDCYAQGNGGSGFVMASPNAVSVVQCRAEFNAQTGFRITGAAFNVVLVGCNTDRNDWDGFLLAHTTGAPPLLLGCLAKRDGRNDDVTPGGFAGFRIAPAAGTGPGAVLSGCLASVSNDDDGSGLRSPDYGVLTAAGANRVNITGGQYLGTVAAIQDGAAVVTRGPGVNVGTVDPATGNITMSTSDRLAVLGNSGAGREVEYWTRGSGKRWSARASSASETGSNAGSDYEIARFSDAGALVDVPVTISRATGVATFKAGVISLPAAGVAPTTGPTLYVSPAGALVFRSAAGTVTQIAPA